MPIEIHETTITTDDAGTIVRLHIADAPLSPSHDETASFRLNLLVRLPRYKAPLVGQLQREAILETRDALGKLGEAEVRQRLAQHVWSEYKDGLAAQWLAFKESSDSSTVRRQTLAVAAEANDLARSANAAASESNVIARAAADSASLSAAAARTNNIIATLALIAATIAIALSIISIFLHH